MFLRELGRPAADANAASLRDATSRRLTEEITTREETTQQLHLKLPQTSVSVQPALVFLFSSFFCCFFAARDLLTSSGGKLY